MKFLKCIWFFFLFAPLLSVGQNSNTLALEYYNRGEFGKASELYEELYNQSNSKTHLDYLIRCYKELGDYKKAEKKLLKVYKEFPFGLDVLVQIGILYSEQGYQPKKIEYYKKAVDELNGDVHQASTLANAFMEQGEYSYAEQVYVTAGKKKKAYGFHMELANVYFYQRNYSGMINELFELLDEDVLYIDAVQSRLQGILYEDIDNSIVALLREKIIERLQKNPNSIEYNSMMLWLSIQELNFQQALVQAKALTKRLQEDGERIYEVVELAYDNKDFSTAIDGCQYLIEHSKGSKYYAFAKTKLLKSLNARLMQSDTTSILRITELVSAYQKTLAEFGRNANTAELIKEMAHIKTFYLGQADEAIQDLESVLNASRLTQELEASLQMEIGDINLFKGELWEADLIYARVEKNNQHNPYGFEAKLKRAKIQYYAGNFDFAKTHLDILKASTSKLIANDAFELALLINNNTALDTSFVGMQMFANAELLFYQNKESEALTFLDSIQNTFPGHSLQDDIYYLKGKYYYEHNKIDEAIAMFEAIVSRFEDDIHADNACFYLGMIYQNVKFNNEKAQEYFKKIMLTYGDSIYVVEARQRYRLLRGDNVN